MEEEGVKIVGIEEEGKGKGVDVRAKLKLSLPYPFKGFVLFLFNYTIVYSFELLIETFGGVEGGIANLVGLVI